ncbi:MAG: hypothetical protein SFV21_00300 [Rhodospirillaceae bacterium]|nr:hypothetical protein [Rhodospirillaceae bacterium]
MPELKTPDAYPKVAPAIPAHKIVAHAPRDGSPARIADPSFAPAGATEGKPKPPTPKPAAITAVQTEDK